MIFTKEMAHQQIAELLEVQSGLHIEAESETQIELTGDIFINCKSKGFFLSENYPVQIVIPLNSNELPYVIDNENRIAKDYPHRYDNGKLCLETETSIRIRFLDSFSLVEWIREFVETYYFSYEFFQRYGEFPFGERGHGVQGIVETYQELFHEKDPIKVFALMKAICEHPYRGHSLCPCGSNQKLRLCHGPIVMKYYMDNRLNKIVQADYKNIYDYLVNCYEQLRYREKAK